ncbi:Methane/Phenol/Toluene Hydroxylase (plasmid) [Mycolicibacterium chubuense NBB4]|uniref:propane 2-monooxygenase n=1 Tax=Mycolicibacterium chubuense (strain NBB4) TaxID=710421 RepID=I4BTH4_MYCCN|nr:aromatic/alkene monooxygenase hydroxylase subunit beta [Mycolicibacterium chubuense]AFM20581.1 Methane/Phenol/Toluene Hydroxylase [Mycolicibacterium chubuense NBB4]
MAVSHIPPQRKALSGNRTFGWVTPKGKRPTEYEDLTVGQQSTPAQFAFQGWPLRFDNGRDPYTEDSTVLRSSNWYAYRDPNQTMNRPYIAGVHEAEKALQNTFLGASAGGLFGFANREWVSKGLAKHYMTYPFVEYGMFLALCYAEREALSDTVTFSIVFEAADKLRHLQDVVYYSFELAEAHSEFSDEECLRVWKEDPVWQGAREAIENVIALDDWMEIVVALNLCFDPLFGELAKVEYFTRFAGANGDLVTPSVIASSEADTVRTRAWTKELIRHLVEDPEYGTHNSSIIAAWVDKWNRYSLKACDAFAPVFSEVPNQPTSYEDAMTEIREKQSQILNELNLDPVTAN